MDEMKTTTEKLDRDHHHERHQQRETNRELLDKATRNQRNVKGLKHYSTTKNNDDGISTLSATPSPAMERFQEIKRKFNPEVVSHSQKSQHSKTATTKDNYDHITSRSRKRKEKRKMMKSKDRSTTDNAAHKTCKPRLAGKRFRKRCQELERKLNLGERSNMSVIEGNNDDLQCKFVADATTQNERSNHHSTTKSNDDGISTSTTKPSPAMQRFQDLERRLNPGVASRPQQPQHCKTANIKDKYDYTSRRRNRQKRIKRRLRVGERSNRSDSEDNVDDEQRNFVAEATTRNEINNMDNNNSIIPGDDNHSDSSSDCSYSDSFSDDDYSDM